MNNKINIKKLKTAAKKLGLEVETNSKNPGFSFNETGKTYSWEEIAESVRERFKRESTEQYNLFEIESSYNSTLYRHYPSKQNMTSIKLDDKNITFFQLKDSLALGRSLSRINRKTLRKNTIYRDNAISDFKKNRNHTEVSYFKDKTVASTYINTNI